MNNKKLLLSIAMIISIVMAVSCSNNGNQTTDPNGPGNTTQQDPVAIDVAEASKAAGTTTLKIELASSGNTTKAPVEVPFTGNDLSDATLTVTGLGFTTSDPNNTTGKGGSNNTWEQLSDSDLAKEHIKLEKEVSSGKYKVSIDNENKVQALKAKLSTNKYAVIGIQVTATKTGKADKNLTFYVVVVNE